VYLFSCDVDVHLSHQRFEGRPRDLVFCPLQFLRASYRPFCLHDLSVTSPSDSGSFYDVNLANVADSVLQTVASDASQNPQPSRGSSSSFSSSSFIGPYSVFYPVCLFLCDVNVQLSHQRFGGRPSGLVFYFLSFLSASYRPSFITRPLRDRVPILAHFMTRISQMLRIPFSAECC